MTFKEISIVINIVCDSAFRYQALISFYNWGEAWPVSNCPVSKLPTAMLSGPKKLLKYYWENKQLLCNQKYTAVILIRVWSPKDIYFEGDKQDLNVFLSETRFHEVYLYYLSFGIEAVSID